MHTNYSSLGCRSRSTIDIFKAQSLDDRSHLPVSGYYASSPSLQFVERRAPITKRCENFAGVFPYARPEDEPPPLPPPRRRLIETSTPTREDKATPRTSFLKKLVASLERRQKEISGACEAADHEFVVVKKNLERSNEGAGRTVEDERTERIRRCVEKQRLGYYSGYARLPLMRRLEDLQERSEHEDDEVVENNLSSPTKYWSTNDLSPPILPITSRNNDASIDDTVANNKPSSSFQQTIKNMFSSLLNWRGSHSTRSLPRSLPKGSREYYAARESLGDELGAFRKHTMPRLIKRATSRGRLDHSFGEASRNREFSNFIRKSNKGVDNAMAIPQPSTATIHKRMTMSRLQERNGSLKVQLPDVPMRKSSLPVEHHLLFLPSKFRDRQRSVTALGPRSLSGASWNRYDMPRPNHRLGLCHQELKFSPPKYENFKPIRNSSICTKF